MINFSDGFSPVSLLTGKNVFVMLAIKKTSATLKDIGDLGKRPFFYIDHLAVYQEKRLADDDVVAIDHVGKSRLIRPNMAMYELEENIKPNGIDLNVDLIYRCQLCNHHICNCDCFLIQGKSRRDTFTTKITEINICPQCKGKVKSLGRGMLFCLDCRWDSGF
ncbi:hypothetical protein CMK18_04485 [Candidatus Poribacteria bacterium]|nr:hypothetical protein [Candidatus Poribacteria bacterium]